MAVNVLIDGYNMCSPNFRQEWKRLRNKYLNVQKKKMQCLKQFLSRNRFDRNSRFHRKDQLQHANGQNQEEQVVHGGDSSEEKMTVERQSKDQPRFTFSPGLIVHAVLDEPVVDVRKFKVRLLKLFEKSRYLWR